MYKAVIFDLDGTLVDSIDETIATLRATSDEINLPWPAQGDRIVTESFGLHTAEILSRLWQPMPEVTPFREALIALNEMVVMPLFPTVPVGLDLLRFAGLTLGILTNRSHREGVTRTLREHGIDEHFSIISCTTDGRAIKPNPAAFDQIAIECSARGIDPHEVVYVGDRAEADWICARSAGIPFIGIGWTMSGRAAFVRGGLPANRIAASFSHAVRLIMDAVRETRVE